MAGDVGLWFSWSSNSKELSREEGTSIELGARARAKRPIRSIELGSEGGRRVFLCQCDWLFGGVVVTKERERARESQEEGKRERGRGARQHCVLLLAPPLSPLPPSQSKHTKRRCPCHIIKPPISPHASYSQPAFPLCLPASPPGDRDTHREIAGGQKALSEPKKKSSLRARPSLSLSQAEQHAHHAVQPRAPRGRVQPRLAQPRLGVRPQPALGPG